MYYRPGEGEDTASDNMLFQYIGILCSLDESDITGVFITSFINNLKAERFIKNPYISFAELLHIHLYGTVNQYEEPKAKKLKDSYEKLNKDIKILEAICINIKTELGCDDDTCFSKYDNKLTLYELAHAVIQVKLSDINIDKIEFLDKIRFEGEFGNGIDTEIKKLIGEFDDTKLRYFIRFATGNVIMPERFTIDVSAGVLNIYAHTCSNTINIPSFVMYKKIKAIIELRKNSTVANSIKMKNNHILMADQKNLKYSSKETLVNYYDFIRDTVFDINNLKDDGGYSKAGGKRKIKK